MRKMETESLFEEIIADSFLYKGRNLDIKFTKSYFQTNLIQRCLQGTLKQNCQKWKIEKKNENKRKEAYHLWRNLHRLSADFSAETLQARERGMIYSKHWKKNLLTKNTLPGKVILQKWSSDKDFSRQTKTGSSWWLNFSSVQLLSRVQLFATPWAAAAQASLSITN